MGQEKIELKFEELSIGLKVIDSEGYKGTIIDIKNIHNVLVQFSSEVDEETGQGLYCVNPECSDDYDPLFLNN